MKAASILAFALKKYEIKLYNNKIKNMEDDGKMKFDTMNFEDTMEEFREK